PRSYFGRFLFGIAYGAGVMATFALLRLIHQPASFDKLLIVPVVNLLVPPIDWFCARFAWLARTGPPGERARSRELARYGWLVSYIVLFVVMLPDLKAPKTSQPKLLPPPAGRVSEDVGAALAS